MQEPNDQQQPKRHTATPPVCGCVDWFSVGETKTVELDSLRVSVRLVGRKGRRARIAIEAPAGAIFRSGPDSIRTYPNPPDPVE